MRHGIFIENLLSPKAKAACTDSRFDSDRKSDDLAGVHTLSGRIRSIFEERLRRRSKKLNDRPAAPVSAPGPSLPNPATLKSFAAE